MSTSEVVKNDFSCTPDLPRDEECRHGDGIMPLGTFSERILINMHEFMNDEAALKVIRRNFAPDVLLQSPLDFDDYINFVSGSRGAFVFLDVKTRDTMVAPSDPEGRGGTVSLSADLTLKQKSDGFVFHVQLNEIYEVTWFKFDGHPGKRLVTKVFGVIDSPIPIPI